MSHDHPTARRFAFRADRHLGVYVCAEVLGGEPVLFVAHDRDGDWQFLCGVVDHSAVVTGASLVCLEHVVAVDPSLNELAELGCGMSADRERVGAGWFVKDDLGAWIRATEPDS